jgi:hypothetical protein
VGRVLQYQPAFSRGEVSEGMVVRTDVDSYLKSLKTLRNAYISNQGGVYRREGGRYVATLPGGAAGRLIPFEFNTEQAYIMVFTPGRFQVYKDDELVATVTSSPISTLTAGQIAEMNYTQSADTLILVHKDVEPIRITRTSHTAWTAAVLPLTNIPVFDYGSGNEAVISATRGWPRAICFFSGRLWLGGLRSRPQTLLASKVADYFNFAVGTGLDDEAINVTIDDDRVNAILNLFPGRTLFVMTTGGEFAVKPSLTDPITPSNIAERLNKATLHGSSAISPLSVDGSVLFLDKSGLVVRQLLYEVYEDSYTADNISAWSPHLIRRPVRMDVRSATDSYPANYTYLVNSDGTMAVLNVLRKEALLGWSLFETDGAYEDVAVLNRQSVYTLVKRTINGSIVRYLEKFDPDYKVDCGVKKTRAGLLNGNFSAGLANWTNLSSGGGIVTVFNGVCALNRNGTGTAHIQQAVVLDAVPYTLYMDVIGNYGLDFVVGSSSGGSQVASRTVLPGLGSVVRFTPPSAGTYYLQVKTPAWLAEPVSVDNLLLVANRWTGLNVLEGENVSVLVDNAFVADNATVASGNFDASITGNAVEVGLFFAAKLEPLPQIITINGESTAGQQVRLVDVNVRVTGTQELVVKCNGKRYKPSFRRFGSQVLDQKPPVKNGWVKIMLGGVAEELQMTVTQDNPLSWAVLGMNVGVGV